MPAPAMAAAHHATTRLDIHEIVQRLNSRLDATLVAALAGSRDSKAPYRWAKPEGPTPRPDAEDRLRVAHRIWVALAAEEDEHSVRAWFIGTNPVLGETSPVMALRDGKVLEVLKAAEAFRDGTWAV